MKKDIILLILLSIASRLPQLLSSNLMLDGDECIMGLMAAHLSELKEFPIFFYGQSYGIAFFETILISLAHLLIGYSTLTPKLPMLILWTAGVVFFYKTLLLIDPGNRRNALLTSIVLILAPSWAALSMIAKGGYHTAFLLSMIISYLLFHPVKNKKLSTYIITGILLVIVFEGQALWLPALLPIVIYFIIKQRKLKHVIVLVTGTALTLTAAYFLKSNLSDFWSPVVFNFNANLIDGIIILPERVYYHMTGSYYLGNNINLGFAVNTAALTYSFITMAVLAYAFFFIIKRTKGISLYLTLCISILFTLGYTLLMEHYAPRYLLPLSVPVLTALYLFSNRIRSKRVLNVLFIILIVLGISSMLSFRKFKYEEQSYAELKELIEYLEKEKIYNTFSKGGLLQWQIMYYSQEKIMSRYFYNTDRYPEYVDRVNKAYLSGKENYAVVGFKEWFAPEENENIKIIANKYFVYKNPDKQKLEEYGFNLPAIETETENSQ